MCFIHFREASIIMNNEDIKTTIEGGWKLVQWSIEYPDGDRTFPFGKDAIGFIVYAADGNMSVTISKKHRQKLNVANPRHVATSTKGDLYDSFFHYCGSWKIIDGSVHHSLMLALNPNMKDTIQVRAIDFLDHNNTLVLSAKEDTADKQRTHKLTWRRETIKV